MILRSFYKQSARDVATNKKRSATAQTKIATGKPVAISKEKDTIKIQNPIEFPPSTGSTTPVTYLAASEAR